MPDIEEKPRPVTPADGGDEAAPSRPAVRYPTAAPAADPMRVYENVPPPAAEEAPGGSKTMRLIYRILRVLLYLAYLGWAAFTCVKLWQELLGKGILQHLTQYAVLLLAPAVAIDVLLRIFRRIGYGKRAKGMKRDRWALSGLILILGFVFAVWMALWTYVIKVLAGL